MKVAAVIPAYNEENTVGDVVKKTLPYVDHVIVVDDGSTDQTGWVAQRAGAEAFKHMENKGAGAATRTGLELAKSFDVAITLDGDGQHNPSEIPLLLSPFKIANPPDVVIGSRFCRGHPRPINLRRYRRFGIDVITWLYNVGYKRRIADAQSCFRAYNRKALDLIDISEKGFGFSTEVLIKARKLGLRVVEVPITCIYHKEREQNSTLNPIRHGIEVAWKTILWRLKLWA